MKSLIIAEHHHQKLHPSFAHVLNGMLKYYNENTVLIVGNDCESVANIAATYAGVTEVIWVDAPCYEHISPQQLAMVIREIAQPYDAIAMASTAWGKSVLPCVSALLDVAMVSDVIDWIDASTVVHPIYAGNAIETVKCLDTKKLFTLRPTAFDKALIQNSSAPIRQLAITVSKAGHTFLNEEMTQSFRPQLDAAKIVVSGGRGLQSKEQFELVFKLADKLGAAVGASRAAVDAGFVTNDYQVGQTGQIVAPELYIALGISGAIQHLAGMKDSKVIVAINKDPDAPIFQIATYGLVGDIFELVPEFIEKL